MAAFKTANQGRTIVEPDSDQGPKGCLIMFPTGDIEGASSPKAALRKIRTWANDNMVADINLMEIEWRGGLTPPENKS